MLVVLQRTQPAALCHGLLFNKLELKIDCVNGVRWQACLSQLTPNLHLEKQNQSFGNLGSHYSPRLFSFYMVYCVSYLFALYRLYTTSHQLNAPG